MGIVKNQIQPGQGQFAANNNERAADMHPTRVAFLTCAQRASTGGSCLFIAGALVVDRVVEFDHLSIDVERVGNVHILLQDHAPKGARHAGFPVAGRPIEEDGGAGVERRAELFKRGIRQDQL